MGVGQAPVAGLAICLSVSTFGFTCQVGVLLTGSDAVGLFGAIRRDV